MRTKVGGHVKTWKTRSDLAKRKTIVKHGRYMATELAKLGDHPNVDRPEGMSNRAWRNYRKLSFKIAELRDRL